MVRLLIFTAMELLHRRKWRVDIHQTHTARAIGIAQFTGALHFQQAFHRLQVVAENQLIVPFHAVFVECAHRLQGHSQRVGDDVFLAILAVIDQFVFPLLGRKQDARPLRRKFFAGSQKVDEAFSLFRAHCVSPSVFTVVPRCRADGLKKTDDACRRRMMRCYPNPTLNAAKTLLEYRI